VNPVRSIIAVLGGIGLASLVVEALEFTLVNAVAGGTIADMAGYFAVRNQPAVLGAKLVYNTLAAVLGGYMTAKIAGDRERLHAGVAALAQTAALIWGFTAGEYAEFTPVWMRIALVVVTGPAMLGGAAIRARAAQHC
jgi:heme/copper-type cytochrome/quinol oxidase subunit 3